MRSIREEKLLVFAHKLVLSNIYIHTKTTLAAIVISIHINPMIDGLSSSFDHFNPCAKYPTHTNNAMSDIVRITRRAFMIALVSSWFMVKSFLDCGFVGKQSPFWILGKFARAFFSSRKFSGVT